MSKQRDYAAEYARRIQRGRSRGVSLSVSRGHPRKAAGEIGFKRAREMLLPGPVRVIRDRRETRVGYRPKYSEIRNRLRMLNLRWSLQILKGKRGRVPTSFVAPHGGGESYLIDDDRRDDFVEAMTGWGFSAREAYTLWFSP
jgi:hypothetical protein